MELERHLKMTDEEKKSLKKLRDFAAGFAACPCCQRSDVCQEGCSYEDDRPHEWDLMQLAREALRVTT
jgi:hypothetical protein